MSDPRFVLPDVDASPSEEVTVVLLGLDAPLLLAGLGLAALADDPGRVAVAVDRLRHGAAAVDAGGLVAEGAAFWRAVRPEVAAVCGHLPSSPDLRRSVERARAALTRLPGHGPSVLAYLTACWLRHADVDAASGA